MSESGPSESIIAADIGSTFTHVCLLDLVEGVYRLIAWDESPSTLGESEPDLMIGLRRAISRLGRVVERPLLDQDGELITPERDSGSGVDLFVATSNAAPPLQCVIVGLMDDLSVESAQRVCATANVTVNQTVSLGTQLRRWDDQMLVELRQRPPDIILLVGGLDTGPVAPLEAAARVLATIYEDVPAERRPVVVFAGNQEARRPLSMLMSPMFDVRVVDNVRPRSQEENPEELQRELAAVYEHIQLPKLPGYRRLRRWCKSPVRSTGVALSSTLRFLSQRAHPAYNVLGLDVGGTMTYVGLAQESSYRWAVGADLGTSFGLDRVLALSGGQGIVRWLPDVVSPEDAISRLENARLRPHSVPQTMEDLLLTHAAARQALVLTLGHLPRPSTGVADAYLATDWIAVRGGALVHTSQDGLIAQSVLDAVQPVGFVHLVVDWSSVWPQLGALAAVAPMAALQVLEYDGLRELGTVLAPLGTAREGAPALHLRIVRDNGPTTAVDIGAGSLTCFPLAVDESAIVETQLEHAFRWDGERRGADKVRVRGGTLGLIVDTRGRPLILPADAQQRRARLRLWLEGLHSDVQHST